MYQPRFYRSWINDHDLVSFSVTSRETDLYIRAASDLETEALSATRKCRSRLEEYISTHPEFLYALAPISVDENAPPIVREMANAAKRVGVGPMAAVAGTIAERVGKELLRFSEEIIVENGGDIFIKTSKERSISIYAGKSRLTGTLAILIQPEDTPLGICTSSGSVGHSLSFGNADAVTVISRSTTLADAAATAIGNLIKSTDDIPVAIDFAQGIQGIRGVSIIKGDQIGLWGKIELVPLKSRNFLLS